MAILLSLQILTTYKFATNLKKFKFCLVLVHKFQLKIFPHLKHCTMSNRQLRNRRLSVGNPPANDPPPPYDANAPADGAQANVDPPPVVDPPVVQPAPNVQPPAQNQNIERMIADIAHLVQQNTAAIARLENLQRGQNVPQLNPNAAPRAPNQNVQRAQAPAHVHAQPPQVAPAQAHGARTHHLKTSDIRIPKYVGASDARTPYDFLLELEKYQGIVGYNEEEMIAYVVPLALQEDAYNWLRYEPAFQNWGEFRTRFRNEFQAIGYEEELRQELERRSQGPNETLTAYIRVIMDYYQRLGRPYNEQNVVTRIMKQMHPEYRQALQGRVIQNLNHLRTAAHEAQEMIKGLRTYKLPPTMGTLEPSLSWRPENRARELTREDNSAPVWAQSDKSASKLHFASVDPYVYHHTNLNRKEVHFGDERNAQSGKRQAFVSDPRPPSREPQLVGRSDRDRTPPQSPTPPRRPATPPRSPGRNCFGCGSPDHYLKDCPRRTPPPGNGRPPSPLA